VRALMFTNSSEIYCLSNDVENSHKGLGMVKYLKCGMSDVRSGIVLF
jgi:hypothetical protein